MNPQPQGGHGDHFSTVPWALVVFDSQYVTSMVVQLETQVWHYWEELSEIIQVGSSSLIGPVGFCLAIKAKVEAMCIGLNGGHHLNHRRLLVEGDSHCVVRWGMGLCKVSEEVIDWRKLQYRPSRM